MQPVRILYRDNHLIVVDKPGDMPVYASNHPKHAKNLLGVLEHHLGRKVIPVFLLDSACSGVLILATSPFVAQNLAQQWYQREMTVRFQILVKGCFREPGAFRFPLFDRHGVRQSAVTCFKPLSNCGPVSLMEVFTETDCRHQIRRHFSRRCANVIGDTRYGQGRWNFFFRTNYDLHRIFMHATNLTLIHPVDGNPLQIDCGLPDDLTAVLQLISLAPSLVNPVNQAGCCYFGYVRTSG